MFALEVHQQLRDWPEKHLRRRHWATLDEVRRLLTDRSQVALAEEVLRMVEAGGQLPAELFSARPTAP